MEKVKEIIKERKFKYICFFWIIISIQFVIGENLQGVGYSINSLSDFFISIIEIILLSITFIMLYYIVLDIFRNLKTKRNSKEKVRVENNTKNSKCKNKFFIYFIIIIICWIPTFLAFFPIIPAYDGPFQIETYFTGTVNTRQPIIHTILLTAFYLFGYKYINSVSYGMMLFSIFQMIIMASIFAYSVKFIEEKTKKKWIRNISLIFYAIFPFNQLFPIITTKDTLFAGFMLLFIIQLYKMLEDKNKKLNYIMIIITTFMFLFRNNAIYAVVASIPFIILTLAKEKQKLSKVIIVLVISILTYNIFNNFLIKLVNAEKDSNQEKMSIFSQGVAKICNENKDELTEEEKQKISYYFGDYEYLGEVYVSYVSDNTKELINCEEIDKDKGKFIKFILQLAKKYPRQFLDSFLNTNRGYWYIWDDSFNKYDNERYPYQKGCLELSFDDHAKITMGLEEKSMLPKLQSFYRNMFCHNDYSKIPILYIVFQPGIYFYIVIAFLLYAIYKKDRNKIVIAVFMFLYFATCILGPIALIRYIYGIIVAMPLVLGMVVSDNENEEGEG